MSASVDDHPLRSIQRSSYIDVGVEVDLAGYAIRSGGRGVFRFECVMPDMVFGDTTDKEYASVQIRPTWFDPTLQTGTTELKVAIHVPPGIAAADLRFQDERQRYSELVDRFGEGTSAHAVAIWESPQHQLNADNPKFGLSFPRNVMQRVVDKSAWKLLIEWFAGNRKLQWWSGGLLLGLLAFAFFRFSHGTGFVVFAVLAGILVFAMVSSPGLHLLCWPLLLPMAGLNEWFLARRRPPTYLPAMATVEGGGIKRGLTAPQAAVLIELPLPKILTMVVFGLLKKGVLQLQSSNPPSVTVAPDYQTTRDARLQVASGHGMVLHDYEQPFIDRLMQHDGPVETCDLNEAMGGLIRSVAQRMQGFDLTATREYYQRIVKRAFVEAESVGEIKQRDETVERNFEWMMMDPDWTVILEDWHRRGYDYWPRWTRTTSSGSHPSVPSTGGRPEAPAGPGSRRRWAKSRGVSRAGRRPRRAAWPVSWSRLRWVWMWLAVAASST